MSIHPPLSSHPSTTKPHSRQRRSTNSFLSTHTHTHTHARAYTGLPQGSIRYHIDRAERPEAIYARYWQEVALVSSDARHAQDERALSTTLLITPNFGLRNREFFEVGVGVGGRLVGGVAVCFFGGAVCVCVLGGGGGSGLFCFIFSKCVGWLAGWLTA